MAVLRIGHVNLRGPAGLIEQLKNFYIDVIGLHEGPRPRFRSGSSGYWLYAGERAVIHLNLFGTDNTYEREVIPGGTTGAIHHVAFECDDLDGMVSRLDTKGLRYERAELPEIALTQLFVVDPNNVLLELNFRGIL